MPRRNSSRVGWEKNGNVDDKNVKPYRATLLVAFSLLNDFSHRNREGEGGGGAAV